MDLSNPLDMINPKQTGGGGDELERNLDKI